MLSPNTRHATTWQGPLLWHDLPPDYYQPLDMTCYLPIIILLSCYHLTPDMIYLTLMIITITGMMTWHLDYILIYSSTNRTLDTHVLLILVTCSYSFLKSNNYLINHKMRQLTSSRGKFTEISIVRVTVVRYVVQLIFRFDLRASRWPRGALAPSFLVPSWKGHPIRPSCMPYGRFRTPAMEHRGPWSRACTGPTVNMNM